jgi:hypothetical protein
MGEEDHYTETRKKVEEMKEKYGDLVGDVQELCITCKKEQADFLSELGARNEGYEIVRTEADIDVKTIGTNSKNRGENKYESRTLYSAAKSFKILLEIVGGEIKVTEDTVDSYVFKDGEKTKKKVKEQKGEKNE